MHVHLMMEGTLTFSQAHQRESQESLQIPYSPGGNVAQRPFHPSAVDSACRLVESCIDETKRDIKSKDILQPSKSYYAVLLLLLQHIDMHLIDR
jgi:hypothetical protein